MKYKAQYLEILKSTTIVLTISSLVGLSFFLYGHPFLPAFFLAVSVQYVLFSVIAAVVKNYFDNQTKQRQLEKIESLSTILECATCSTANVTTFVPDDSERFEFVCTKCNSRNVVNINFTVAKVMNFEDPFNVSPRVSTPTSL